MTSFDVFCPCCSQRPRPRSLRPWLVLLVWGATWLPRERPNSSTSSDDGASAQGEVFVCFEVCRWPPAAPPEHVTFCVFFFCYIRESTLTGRVLAARSYGLRFFFRLLFESMFLFRASFSEKWPCPRGFAGTEQREQVYTVHGYDKGRAGARYFFSCTSPGVEARFLLFAGLNLCRSGLDLDRCHREDRRAKRCDSSRRECFV